MTVLVTGGAGYFGEILVRRLLESGRSVRVLDVAENPALPKDVETRIADVRDRRAVDAALEGVEVIHHAVAQVPLAKDVQQFWSVNVEGTRNVLAAALARSVRKVVLVSSSATYGAPKHNPVTRATQLAPREAYGRAKAAADGVAEDHVDRGLDVTIVRPRTILGHGRLGIFQIVFEWVRRGRPLFVLGRGDNRFQLVHADDLADLCLRAAERPGPAVYLGGATRFGTMRQLLEGLVRHAGSVSPVRSLPLAPAAAAMKLSGRLGLTPLADYHALMYGRELYFDVSDAERELGWSPRFSNDEMIADSYEYYLAHREEIRVRRNASHHRSPARLGALDLLELLP